MRFCFRAVAGLMAVAWALPAVVGLPPGAGEPAPGAPVAAQPVKAQLKMKVFKLERGDPETVIDSLNALLGDSNVVTVPPMVPGGPPGGVGAPPAVGAPPPGVGFGGVPGVGFGGGPPPAAPQFGGIGCFIGNGGGNATPVWRATAQPRTRAVIVRGSDRHLNIAADMVALLDRPANAPLPKLQVVKAFALKHATAEELAEVINALSFDDIKLATPNERLLALVAPDEVVKSVAELVTELDVQGPGAPDRKPEPEPRKEP